MAGEFELREGRWVDGDQRATGPVLVAAEVAGVVAGIAALHAIPLLEHDGCRGRLVALVVDEAYRGHGVGRALVEALSPE